MGMISMKLSKDPNDIAPYGCGLCIRLDEEQVEALGLDKHPPAPGAKVGLRAIAIVRRVTQEADPDEAEEKGEDGDIDVALELQITEMEVSQQGREAASVLYGCKDDE